MRRILILLSLLVIVSNSQTTLWKIVGSKVYLANKFWTLSMREGLGTGMQLGYVTSGDSGSVRYYNGSLQYYDGGAWRTVGYSGDPNSFSKPQIDTVGTVVSGIWNATPITRAYTNAKIALINGLSDSAVTHRVDTTSATGAPVYSASSPNIDLRLPFARMKQISWTLGLQDTLTRHTDTLLSHNNRINAAIQRAQDTLNTKKYISDTTGTSGYAPNWSTPSLVENNTFASGTTQTMPELAVTDTAHIGFVIPDSVHNLKFACKKTENDTLTLGTWDTLAVLSPGISGVISRIFVALFCTTSFPSMDSIKIRITYDGAATPQIGGANGIPILALFGRPFDSNYVFFSERLSISSNSENRRFGGNLNKIYLPFSNGVLIEIYTPSVVGTSFAFTMLEYSTHGNFIVSGINLSNWRLHANYIADTTITGLDSLTMLLHSGESLLFGVLHNLKFSSVNNFQLSEEGNYLIYYDNESTPSYESSGGEDFWNSSFYFNNADNSNLKTYYLSDYGLIYLDQINFSKVSVYRFFDFEFMPRAKSEIKLKWINGSNSSGTPGNTTSESLVFYYVKN